MITTHPHMDGTNEEDSRREFGWASRIAVVLEPAIIPVLPYHILWLLSWDAFRILIISRRRISENHTWLASKKRFLSAQAILWVQPTWRSGVFVLLGVIGNTDGWALDHKFLSAGTCWWLVLCRNLWKVFNLEVEVLTPGGVIPDIRNKATENCMGKLLSTEGL